MAKAGAIAKQRRRRQAAGQALKPAAPPRAPRMHRKRRHEAPMPTVAELPADEPASDEPAADPAAAADAAAADSPLAQPDGDYSLDDITRALANPDLTKKQRAALTKLYRLAFKRDRAEAKEAAKEHKLENAELKITEGVPFLQEKVDSFRNQRNLAYEALGIGGDNLPGMLTGAQLEDSGDDGGAAGIDVAALLGGNAGLDNEPRVSGLSGIAERYGLPSWSLPAAGGLLLLGVGYYFLRRR